MGQKGSLSSSALSFVYAIVYWGFLFSNFANARGFDSLLQQLPQLGAFSNIFESKIVLNVKDYGAKGDGIRDDTEVFAEVWDKACSSKVKEARIIIPDGSHCLVRPISLAGPCISKITLMISGSIVAPSNPDVWHGSDTHKWLYFHTVDHLKVEGGTIDGMGKEWWDSSCKINPKNVFLVVYVTSEQPCRHAPTAITFHRCNKLVIKNLMIVNGQQMHIAFTTCNRVTISKLGIFAPSGSPNTDGIHISASTNVQVKDSTIRTGDDCISIVSNSSKVKIRNIVCGPGHGISIGSLGKSGSCDQVYDVSVRGVFLSNTENGLRIKTWQGGSGFVSNVKFEDVLMENVSNPIIIDQYYCDSRKACANKVDVRSAYILPPDPTSRWGYTGVFMETTALLIKTCAVNVEKISYVNIKGTSASKEAINFACSDVAPCEGLYLEDVQLVSATGGITTSFCWEARGSTSGTVYPPPCYSLCSSFINQITSSITHLQAI